MKFPNLTHRRHAYRYTCIFRFNWTMVWFFFVAERRYQAQLWREQTGPLIVATRQLEGVKNPQSRMGWATLLLRQLREAKLSFYNGILPRTHHRAGSELKYPPEELLDPLLVNPAWEKATSGASHCAKTSRLYVDAIRCERSKLDAKSCDVTKAKQLSYEANRRRRSKSWCAGIRNEHLSDRPQFLQSRIEASRFCRALLHCHSFFVSMDGPLDELDICQEVQNIAAPQVVKTPRDRRRTEMQERVVRSRKISAVISQAIARGTLENAMRVMAVQQRQKTTTSLTRANSTIAKIDWTTSPTRGGSFRVPSDGANNDGCGDFVCASCHMINAFFRLDCVSCKVRENEWSRSECF